MAYIWWWCTLTGITDSSLFFNCFKTNSQTNRFPTRFSVIHHCKTQSRKWIYKALLVSSLRAHLFSSASRNAWHCTAEIAEFTTTLVLLFEQSLRVPIICNMHFNVYLRMFAANVLGLVSSLVKVSFQVCNCKNMPVWLWTTSRQLYRETNRKAVEVVCRTNIQ